MRLTCPRCSAQYEIPDGVIPASGREVECSACTHVWYQHGTDRAEIGQNSAPSEAVDTNYDPGARPALNRPLNDSILSILREETARELSARQPGARDPAPTGDHIPATVPDAKLSVESFAQPDPASDQSDPQDFTWPVATVILPGPPLTDLAGAELTGAELTGAEQAGRKMAGAEQASEWQPENRQELPPELPTTLHDATPTERTDPAPTPLPPAPIAALPDAAQLAATLTRTTPSAAPISTTETAADIFPVETLTASDPDPAQIGHLSTMRPAAADADLSPVARQLAPVPAVIDARQRPHYWMGLGLAAMLSLAFVAFYALAPRLAPTDQPGSESGLISTLRGDIDQGRLWLNDKARALKGTLTGH